MSDFADPVTHPKNPTPAMTEELVALRFREFCDWVDIQGYSNGVEELRRLYLGDDIDAATFKKFGDYLHEKFPDHPEPELPKKNPADIHAAPVIGRASEQPSRSEPQATAPKAGRPGR